MPEEHRAKKNEVETSKITNEQKHKQAEDYKLACSLVPILKDFRANDYEAWIQLGFCLHNIDRLQSMIRFSKRSVKYQEGCCRTEWLGMSNLTEGLVVFVDGQNRTISLNSTRLPITIVVGCLRNH